MTVKSKKAGKAAGARQKAGARRPSPAAHKTARATKAAAPVAPRPAPAAVTKAPERKPYTGKRFGARELREFRTLLLAARDQLKGQIESLKGDSLKREDAVNSEEDGTDAFERQFALNIAWSENDSVFEIDDALRRIEEGSYGVCEDCGELINMPRLKALPFVRLCIGCKAKQENGRGAHASLLRRRFEKD